MPLRSSPLARRRTLAGGLVVLLGIASLVGALAFVPEPQEAAKAKPFEWETDLERAIQDAERTDRPLLLVFR